MVRRSLATLAFHPRVSAVRPVIHPDDQATFDRAAAGLDLLPPVAGGATRQESSRKGLESLASDPPRRVLIHDAARPLLDSAIIDRVLGALDAARAAIPVLPVNDTLKRATDHGTVDATVERAKLWRAQTPQGFEYAAILEAHRAAADQSLTDDAAVAEAAGLDVVMVAGSEENLKVTTGDDFRRAERLLAGRDFRVGTGFDAHRFAPGDHVVLCGVSIPHDRGLAGHSDADVGLHALTNAILGAMAAGDLGDHFPPSDAKWKNESSAVFLRHAATLVGERGGEIRHLDVTLICERPKIASHREAMQKCIAGIVGIDPTRVSVKATTTEGRGFTGRNEGVAAQAVATVAL